MARQDTSGVENPERRKTLRLLAALPISVYGLTFLGSTHPTPAEEFLPQCTAGLTACWHLSKGTDLAFVQSAVFSYLPTLTTLAKQPSRQQQAAAIHLLSEAHMLAGFMTMHVSGPSIAKHHFTEAVKYSRETQDDNLKSTALRYLAWVFDASKHPLEALNTCKQAIPFLKNVTPLVCSRLYTGLSQNIKPNVATRRMPLRSLGNAHEAFLLSRPKLICIWSMWRSIVPSLRC